ncbi:MAG: site-specific integrase [Desulfobulbaceae bacterium]|nr:site-specific integrase [Desulfobulbaceae bacterium]
MASIEERKRKFGTVYKAYVCVNKKRLSATFDSKAKALTWAEETEYLLRAGLPLEGDLPDGDMDFAQAVDKYTMAVAPRKKLNTRRLDIEIGKRLINYFDGKSLQKISSSDIAEYRDYRLQSVGSSSIIQDLSFIRCLYRMARVEWRLTVTDPTVDIRRPSAPKHRLTLLQPTEIDRLLDFCCISRNEKLYCYVLLMLHTAMRPSEGAGLIWNQVLLDQRIIDLTETKTDPRRVPMTKTVHGLLKGLKDTRGPDDTHVFLPNDNTYREQPHRFFRRSFSNAVAAAGIKNFTLYGLRHSAASYLIMNGVDIRTVAEIMGHRNISQTMKYTHFLDTHKIDAIQRLDRIGR